MREKYWEKEDVLEDPFLGDTVGMARDVYEFADGYLSANTRAVVAINGEAGTGKTIFLQMLAWHLIHDKKIARLIYINANKVEITRNPLDGFLDDLNNKLENYPSDHVESKAQGVDIFSNLVKIIKNTNFLQKEIDIKSAYELLEIDEEIKRKIASIRTALNDSTRKNEMSCIVIDGVDENGYERTKLTLMIVSKIMEGVRDASVVLSIDKKKLIHSIKNDNDCISDADQYLKEFIDDIYDIKVKEYNVRLVDCLSAQYSKVLFDSGDYHTWVHMNSASMLVQLIVVEKPFSFSLSDIDRLIFEIGVIADIYNVSEDGPPFPFFTVFFIFASEFHRTEYKRYVSAEESILEIHRNLFHIVIPDEIRYRDCYVDDCVCCESFFLQHAIRDTKTSEDKRVDYFKNYREKLESNLHSADVSAVKKKYSRKIISCLDYQLNLDEDSKENSGLQRFSIVQVMKNYMTSRKEIVNSKANQLKFHRTLFTQKEKN